QSRQPVFSKAIISPLFAKAIISHSNSYRDIISQPVDIRRLSYFFHSTSYIMTEFEALNSLNMSDPSANSTKKEDDESVKTNITLMFHPDFCLPETLAIIRTADGQNFRFSLPLLAQLSTFFANIVQLNLGLDKTEIIELPSATTPALHIVLCLISNSISTNLSRKPLPYGSTILKHLPEVLTIIDAYDLHIVRPLLAKFASEIFHDEPGSVFTVAALLGDEKLAVIITKSNPSLQIDSTCRYTFAAKYLCRVHEFQNHNREEDSKLEQLIKHSEFVQGGPAHDFINACKKRGGCATYVEYEESPMRITRLSQVLPSS
ncbi:hypothetical protein BCR39DRAFT_573601, partial [Naematelia encephala]